MTDFPPLNPFEQRALREKALQFALSYVEADDESYMLHEVLRGAGEVYDFLAEGTLPRVQDES
jgi:hypothetical protein